MSSLVSSSFRPATLAVAVLCLVSAGAASAANSAACTGGGFSALGRTGKVKIQIAANKLPRSFVVKGKYVEFEVDTATLGISNYTLTGAANPLDMTGGARTIVFASKAPELAGRSLTGDLELELKDGDTVIKRKGGLIDMKIQAKDCAQGGVFQMEVERDDNQPTVFRHVLADNTQNANLTPFYFDNRNFRNREGDRVPFGTTFITVPSRVNFGNDFSPKFVGRDSAQLATRLSDPTCANTIVNRNGQPVIVNHCGGASRWNVQSGGRMGMVLGEDAVEVAPGATDCAENCQAQNQVNGAAVVLGFPFPVAPADRLQPRTP